MESDPKQPAFEIVELYTFGRGRINKILMNSGICQEWRPTPRRLRFMIILLGMLLWVGLVGLLEAEENSLHQIHHPAQDIRISTPEERESAAWNNLRLTLNRLPLYFEENRGQIDGQVKFLARGSGYTLFMTPDEVVLVLRCPQQDAESAVPHPLPETKFRKGQDDERKTAVLRMRLAGSITAPRITGMEELSGKVSYFIGNDPNKWHTNIPLYRKVRYQDVYPGVDLVYYGNSRHLEYDFVVGPGIDPKIIRLRLQGPDRVEIDDQKDLVIWIGGGRIRLHTPHVYQEVAGVKQVISGSYVLLPPTSGRDTDKGTHEVGFEVGMYDASRPLVIDPVLSYSTYLGGGDTDYGRGIAVDAAGNVYVTGYTYSGDFPTVNPIQATYIGCTSNFACPDVFVTKIDAAGSALIYSTYLGGSDPDGYYGHDTGHAIAVDSFGNAYVTGETNSDNFPLVNPIQATRAGLNDAFVAKLNAEGSALVYSTYLGGSGDENYFTSGIAVDATGHAYVTGVTYSTDFPTANPWQANNAGGSDVFVAKLSPIGSALVYSTYLGGSDDDAGCGIAVDAAGNAYVTGYTYSTNFPTVNPIQATKSRDHDAFLTKVNPAGSALAYSTYLGGSDEDFGQGIAVDTAGNAYVTGSTSSTDFPTTDPIQAAKSAGHDAFVTKVNPAGSALAYSTYLGGSGDDFGYGIAVDATDNAYVTGYTSSSNFPTVGPIQATNRGGYYGNDAFVTKLNVGGTALLYSTYLGGSGDDYAFGTAVDASGNAYVAGGTCSSNFLTMNPIQAYGGDCDAFVAKISVGFDYPDISVTPNPVPFGSMNVGGTLDQTITVKNDGNANLLIGTITNPSLPFIKLTDNCSGKSISPNGTCTVTYQFAPTSEGSFSSNSNIPSNDPDENPKTVALTGTGTRLQRQVTFRLSSPVSVGINSSNYLTVTYFLNGQQQKVNIWAPPWPQVMADVGSTYTYALTSSGSTSTHRWATNDPLTGTVESGSGTLSVSRKYYEQYYVTVNLNGTDSGHTVGTELRTLFGQSATEVGLYGSWNGWCDGGSTLRFAESSSGSPVLYAQGIHSWEINSSEIYTVTYSAVQTPGEDLLKPPEYEPYYFQLRDILQTGCESYNPDQSDPDLSSRIDPNKPTIVLTHGWNPDYPFFRDERGDVPDSVSVMCKRFLKHGYDKKANILWWNWLGQATSASPVGPAKEAARQGVLLANALVSTLGQSYGQRFHFIGFSLGTQVNKVAVDALHSVSDWRKMHVTILDAAEIGDLAKLVTPIPNKAAWIDNYISAFGDLHEEAANVILREYMPISGNPSLVGTIEGLITSHQFAYNWYRCSIVASDTTDNCTPAPIPEQNFMGDQWSFEAGGLNGSPGAKSKFVQTLSTTDSPLNIESVSDSGAWTILAGRTVLLSAQTGLLIISAIKDSIKFVGDVVTDVVVKVIEGVAQSLLKTILTEGSNAYMWVPIKIPENTTHMSFEFLFTQPGDGDFLSVGINQEQVFAFEGGLFPGLEFINSSYIDVSKWAGQDVQLFVGLKGVGGANAQVVVQDFRFYRLVLPSATTGTLIDDDFTDGIIDSTIWTDNGWSGGSVAESGGVLSFLTGSANDRQVRTKINIGAYGNFSITFKIRIDSVAGDKNVGFWLGNLTEGDPGPSHRGYYVQFHSGTKGFTIGVRYDGGGGGLHDKYDPPKWSPGSWYPIKMERINGTMNFYFNNALVVTDSNYASLMTDLYWVTGRTWRDPRSGESAQISIDDFLVTTGTSTETISTPSAPSGPASGNTGISCTYSTGDSTSSVGHSVEYQFDWKGDGTDLSLWGAASQSKIWTVAGTYFVRARARCVTDTSVVSSWSNSLTVIIIDSVPDIFVSPMSNDFGNVKVKKTKTASFKVKNNGNANLLITTAITGADASMFKIAGGGGSKTIKPGRSLMIKVRFKPTSTGSKSSIVRITSNDPDTPTMEIPLSGTGQ